MKRIYADLHLCPNFNDSKQVVQMVGKASELGYGLLGFLLPPNFAPEKLQWLRNLCSEYSVDFVSRLDLRPRSPRELIDGLRRFRRRFEVVAVVCESKPVARQAAKDRRVDFLSFSSFDFRWRFFDRAEAELVSGGLACLEVDAERLLVLERVARVRLLSCLRRETAIARGFGVPLVVSSGVSDVLLMRRPRELAALASLFGLDEVSAVRAVSETPVAIVKRNREKLCEEFVAPGIRVVRRGKDC